MKTIRHISFPDENLIDEKKCNSSNVIEKEIDITEECINETVKKAVECFSYNCSIKSFVDFEKNRHLCVKELLDLSGKLNKKKTKRLSIELKKLYYKLNYLENLTFSEFYDEIEEYKCDKEFYSCIEDNISNKLFSKDELNSISIIRYNIMDMCNPQFESLDLTSKISKMKITAIFDNYYSDICSWKHEGTINPNEYINRIKQYRERVTSLERKCSVINPNKEVLDALYKIFDGTIRLFESKESKDSIKKKIVEWYSNSFKILSQYVSYSLEIFIIKLANFAGYTEIAMFKKLGFEEN